MTKALTDNIVNLERTYDLDQNHQKKIKKKIKRNQISFLQHE